MQAEPGDRRRAMREYLHVSCSEGAVQDTVQGRSPRAPGASWGPVPPPTNKGTKQALDCIHQASLTFWLGVFNGASYIRSWLVSVHAIQMAVDVVWVSTICTSDRVICWKRIKFKPL